MSDKLLHGICNIPSCGIKVNIGSGDDFPIRSLAPCNDGLMLCVGTVITPFFLCILLRAAEVEVDRVIHRSREGIGEAVLIHFERINADSDLCLHLLGSFNDFCLLGIIIIYHGEQLGQNSYRITAGSIGDFHGVLGGKLGLAEEFIHELRIKPLPCHRIKLAGLHIGDLLVAVGEIVAKGKGIKTLPGNSLFDNSRYVGENSNALGKINLLNLGLESSLQPVKIVYKNIIITVNNEVILCPLCSCNQSRSVLKSG